MSKRRKRMKKIKIITDSNSGISQEEAKKLKVFVIPMPFTIDGEEYLEDINITQEEFYHKLKDGADVHTSQPSQIYLEELWKTILEDYEQIIYIPMSSGLSSTCENAKQYAKAFGGRVHVVDNRRISVTLRESVMEAIELVKRGNSAQQIKEYLESTADKSSIHIMVASLKYLKKGGRISPATAAIGSLLNIKPILHSQGGQFEKEAMTLSVAQAKKKLVSIIKSELETIFKDEYAEGKMMVSIAHTQNEKEAKELKHAIAKALPNAVIRFINPLSLSVACHIGPGSLACALSLNNYHKRGKETLAEQE